MFLKKKITNDPTYVAAHVATYVDKIFFITYVATHVVTYVATYFENIYFITCVVTCICCNV